MSKKRKLNKFEEFERIQQLGKSWNPLPKREDFNKTSRLHLTVDSRAGFINCAQGYFNVGKYKGVQVKDAPIWYLTWVAEKIQLNPSELNLLRKIVKNK